MNKYDYWLESGADQSSQGEHQEYIWDNYMKPGEVCDPLDLDNFEQYFSEATASKDGVEKWNNLRQYADRKEWENFGRAVYFLVHDYIENKLIAEEE